MPQPAATLPAARAEPVRKRAVGLYTIIGIKAAKAVMLVLLALALFHVMNGDLPERLGRLLRFVNLNPERALWVALGRHLGQWSPAGLHWLAQGCLLYAALLGAESLGLALRRYWAVWLAIGETAFFIPIEVLDLVKHPSRLITAILVLNLVIVVYLVRNRDRLFHHHPHPR